MPLYEFQCDTCGRTEEFLLRVDDRNTKQMICWETVTSLDYDDAAEYDLCRGQMRRIEISETAPGRTDSRFQMQAITGSGKRIDGNFGGSAARKDKPLFTQGVKPSKQDQRKNAHKAFKNRGRKHERIKTSKK